MFEDMMGKHNINPKKSRRNLKKKGCGITDGEF
ncbi:MAG: hypothetical protein ACJAVQ_001680 [Nonlabens sp.]|jgi:hypothetical protein